MAGLTAGIEITTMGDIPSEGVGLGSSSTVTVGALHAMYSLQGELVPAERLAKEACQIEIDVLGKPIGVQDQYIAAYGGLRLIEFGPGDEVRCRQVELSPDGQRRLRDSLMLFYTGVSRQAGAILAEQKASIPDRAAALEQMKALAYCALEALQAGEIDALGQLLHQNWQLKKSLASKISNGHLDDLYTAARRAGALGGKITGAGGGGFLLLYCPHARQDAVRVALSGLRELPFDFEPDGSKVIFNYKR